MDPGTPIQVIGGYDWNFRVIYGLRAVLWGISCLKMNLNCLGNNSVFMCMRLVSVDFLGFPTQFHCEPPFNQSSMAAC